MFKIPNYCIKIQIRRSAHTELALNQVRTAWLLVEQCSCRAAVPVMERLGLLSFTETLDHEPGLCFRKVFPPSVAPSCMQITSPTPVDLCQQGSALTREEGTVRSTKTSCKE